MADDGPPVSIIHPAEPVIYMVIIALLLGAVVMRFNEFLFGHSAIANFLNILWLFLQGKTSFSDVIGATGSSFLTTAVFALKFASFFLSLLFVYGIVYALRKHNEAYKKMHAPIQPPKEVFYGVKGPETTERPVNPKWVKVLEHVNSTNSSDWRLAIIEADIMLNDLLDKLGHHGVTLGDKLKGIEPSDFDTLQEAWEAHKVRNAIAHEGSDLSLNKPEAERVVKLFEKVFKEFQYV